MKKLKTNYFHLKFKIINLLLILLISKSVFANNTLFEIQGNNFTDSNVILSLLNKIPETVDEEFSNDIIKVLNNSNLFSDVSVRFIDNKYIINVKEYPNIDKLYFENNERLEDIELKQIASDINFINDNNVSLNLFINEVKKVYESFGYNNVNINYSKKIYEENNTIDFYFDIQEGKITKVNKIIINGNNSISGQDILANIKTKTRSIRNIFANNNFKPFTVESDKYKIINYYKNNGFLNVDVNVKIEYFKSNRVNIYFNIIEGDVYSLVAIDIVDENNILNSITANLINLKTDSFLNENSIFSYSKAQQLRKDISSTIIDSGVEFFEINSYEKISDKNVKILYQISPIAPKYTNLINIEGNYRTYDYVIRRELSIVEGDAIYPRQIKSLKDKLTSLNLFESVNIKEDPVDDKNVNLIIEIEEKQTGSFNAGVSLGTLDGFAIVTGLRERNFYGTGRSLDILLNTSEDKNQFKFITTDRLSYENDANISYSINYKQEDFSNASSYKLDSFSSGIGVGYRLNKKLIHNIDLEYVLKDYNITNSTTVSETIASSSGSNISYLLKNNFSYSTLNPGFISKKGNYFNFNNTIETPTSSSNGFIKNTLTFKNYFNSNDNIFSIQTKIGNIFSLNNNDILTDDKFSLGGRWLRGFDNFGAGPRNSRTSYVGGNNLIATKFDYSHEITKKSDFPIYLNLFNDYGLVWENKTNPTNNDNSLRSSVGFGIKYYSPIGPIGFTWGFPIIDEKYDINRMFLFSIGNID
tara:strand:+ start:289 stop:2559 length:2271 start_codon:yes stop_codon:yes gene_type:complete